MPNPRAVTGSSSSFPIGSDHLPAPCARRIPGASPTTVSAALTTAGVVSRTCVDKRDLSFRAKGAPNVLQFGGGEPRNLLLGTVLNWNRIPGHHTGAAFTTASATRTTASAARTTASAAQATANAAQATASAARTTATQLTAAQSASRLTIVNAAQTIANAALTTVTNLPWNQQVSMLSSLLINANPHGFSRMQNIAKSENERPHPGASSPHASVRIVISGGHRKRKGTPTAPIPRLT
jgi:hypothetical protein